jgi:hypothetical protein
LRQNKPRGKYARLTINPKWEDSIGMKAHVGVDSKIWLIHSAAVTAANVHSKQVLPACGTEASGPQISEALGGEL